MTNAMLAAFARTVSLSLLCLCSAAAAAQEKPPADDQDALSPPVLEVVIEEVKPGAGGVPRPAPEPAGPRQVEQMPQFPGGDAALKAYLGDNLRYPAKALDHRIQGVVVVEFDVDVDGKLGNVLVRRDIGGDCAAEAVRLVRNMPPWQPGRARGEAVKATYSLRVDFALPQGRKDRDARR